MIRPKQLVKLLDIIQSQGIDFKAAVIGGAAAIAHGVHRSTIDLDILIDTNDMDLINLKTVIQKILDDNNNIFPGLEELGALTLKSQKAARPGSEETFKNAIITLFNKDGDRMVDILGSYWTYDKEALNSSIPLEDYEPLNVITKPFLIIMKLKANGPRDRADIYEIYDKADDTTKQEIRNIVTKYGYSKKLQSVIDSFNIEPDDEPEPDSHSSFAARTASNNKGRV